jgi:hypothetical protein
LSAHGFLAPVPASKRAWFGSDSGASPGPFALVNLPTAATSPFASARPRTIGTVVVPGIVTEGDQASSDPFVPLIAARPSRSTVWTLRNAPPM